MKSENNAGSTLFELFASFFKIGLFTFGGGLAMLPLIQRAAVEEKGWLTEEEMLDCVAVAQSLPGVIAINAATYIGAKCRGIKGAVAATLGVVLPSFAIIIAALLLLSEIGENARIAGAFTAVKAASCALILYSAIKLGRQALKSGKDVFIAAAAFALIAIFGINAIWVILGAAATGLAISGARSAREGRKKG